MRKGATDCVILNLVLSFILYSLYGVYIHNNMTVIVYNLRRSLKLPTWWQRIFSTYILYAFIVIQTCIFDCSIKYTYYITRSILLSGRNVISRWCYNNIIHYNIICFRRGRRRACRGHTLKIDLKKKKLLRSGIPV